jgi:hypothetical protein
VQECGWNKSGNVGERPRIRALGRREKAWTVEESGHFYEETLKEAAAVANWSVSKGFEDSWRKTFEEFQDFLPLVRQGNRVGNATGLDIIAFIHGFWMKKHRDQCQMIAGGK